LVASEREHREQFEELSLLQARGSELCLTIVSSPQVRKHLSVGCGPLPFSIPKWSVILPHFKQQCLLPWSWCLGTHLMRPSEWKSWVS
jgi:hypothetical protein